MEFPFLFKLSMELIAKLENDDHILTNNQVKAIFYFIFITTYKMGQIDDSLIWETSKVIVEEKWPLVWSDVHDREQYLKDVIHNIPAYFNQLLMLKWSSLSEKTLAILALNQYDSAKSFFSLHEKRTELAKELLNNGFPDVDETSKLEILKSLKPAQPN